MTVGIKKPGGNRPSKYQQLARVLFLRKSIKSACERTTPWLTVHAYWTMAWAKIKKKENRKIYKERQNAYKEEDQYIIKGGREGK